MAFKIYTIEADWQAKEAEYHTWASANVSRYNADQWALVARSKHPSADVWYLLIPASHSDTGEAWDEAWRLTE